MIIEMRVFEEPVFHDSHIVARVLLKTALSCHDRLKTMKINGSDQHRVNF